MENERRRFPLSRQEQAKIRARREASLRLLLEEKRERWKAILTLYQAGGEATSCRACEKPMDEGGGYVHKKYSHLRYCGACLRRDAPGGS